MPEIQLLGLPIGVGTPRRITTRRTGRSRGEQSSNILTASQNHVIYEFTAFVCLAAALRKAGLAERAAFGKLSDLLSDVFFIGLFGIKPAPAPAFGLRCWLPGPQQLSELDGLRPSEDPPPSTGRPARLHHRARRVAVEKGWVFPAPLVAVPLAKPGVPAAVRVGPPVLLPEQAQRTPLRSFPARPGANPA